MRALVVLVACAAVVLWAWRVWWDQDHPLQAAARGLGADDVSRRVDAIHEVSELGFRRPGESIRLLMPLLDDRDAVIRQAAAGELGLLGANAIGQGADLEEVRAATTALLDRAKDPDDRVRAAATTSLSVIVSATPRVAGRMGGATPKASPLVVDFDAVAAVLAGALDAPDEPPRTAAISGLRAAAPKVSGGPPPALIRAMDDGSAANRSAAAAALAGYRQGLDPAIPPLIRHLEDEALEVRSACAQALRTIRPPAVSPAVAPAVLAALRHSDRSVRASLATLLGRVRPDPDAAVPALLTILREETSPGARPGPAGAEVWPDPGEAAAEALGQVAPGTPRAGEAMAALLDIVRHGRPQHRRAAADALGAFGPEAIAAVPVLIGLVNEALSIPEVTPASDAATRGLAQASSAAIRALGQIAPGTPAADAALRVLIEALGAEWVWTRWHALKAVAAFGPRAAAARPAIRELKDTDDNSEVRAAAARALEAVGPL